MRKILIIDDEKPTLNMFRLFLTAYGHHPLTAENGEEGLRVFEQERPDIVLTDIKMPGIDGIETLTRLKRLDPAAEVIVITGHGDIDLAIKALNLDATDFINKPIQKADLDAALKRAEERLRLAAERHREVLVRQAGAAAVLDIRGSLCSASEPYLTAAFETVFQSGAKAVLLSFDDNASINGAGIAVLIQLLGQARTAGLSAAITGLSANFRRILETVGVTAHARIHDTEEKALKALAKK